ncbi:hypothetical protein PR048_030309 [Dryococelus australis]|uniref:Uncharacterized protein n=1 Tax=Dryococelus australis TaxID=614101 RepID=A0ABQ9GCI3_9NEOP|nr:hypothetical protein PR048_030309 [Dryococelus australis]
MEHLTYANPLDAGRLDSGLSSCQGDKICMRRYYIYPEALFNGWPARLPPRRTGFNRRATPGFFRKCGIVADDAAGRRVSSGISRFTLPLPSGVPPFSPHFTLICSQELVKSRSNLSPLPHITPRTLLSTAHRHRHELSTVGVAAQLRALGSVAWPGNDPIKTLRSSVVINRELTNALSMPRTSRKQQFIIVHSLQKHFQISRELPKWNEAFVQKMTSAH